MAEPQDPATRNVASILKSLRTRTGGEGLVSTGVPTTHPLVSNALAQIWNSYGEDTAALWAWDNGDLTIWMTFDAVEARRLANLAVPAHPG